MGAREGVDAGALVGLAAPCVLAVLWLGATAVIESRGIRMFGAIEPRNLAEAAAAGRAADVLRFLALDSDPTRVYDVRPGFIAPDVTRVTAIEAAVWSRQLALVELLEATAGALDERGRRQLACLAVDVRARDIADHLAPGGIDCTPGAAAEAIRGRS
jgi:hypothetical protein